MSIGDEVIWLPDAWEHGMGEIKGITRHGWLWIRWADGHFDSYRPHDIELFTAWEDRLLSLPA